MISVNNTRPIKDLHFNDLLPAICSELSELFTLTGKYQDDEKIKMFGKHLTNDLPVKYPYLTISELSHIFKNAIRGDYGELKTISLPELFKWVRKWQESSETGQRTHIQYLCGPQTESSDLIDWSHEAYKAYQKYLLGGMKQHEFSHFIYDRMLLDNFFPLEYYQKWMPKAAELLWEEPNKDSLIQIYCAKRISVLEKFNEIKSRGVNEIYQQHKQAR